MNKRIAALLGSLLLALAAHAQAQQQAPDTSEQQTGRPQVEQAQAERETRGGPPIYPTLAAALIEMGVPVIDIRSEAEVEETGTVAAATHIPHTDIDAIADFIGDDTSRAVVMYCGSGRRVDLAIEALRERGYHGMVNAGGYENLREALEGENEG